MNDDEGAVPLPDDGGLPAGARKWEASDVSDPHAMQVMDDAEEDASQAIETLTGTTGEHRRFWLFDSEQRRTPYRTILLVAEATYREALTLAARRQDDPGDAVNGSMLSLAWAIMKATERAAIDGATNPMARIQAAVQARYAADFIRDLPDRAGLASLFERAAHGKRYLFWALFSAGNGAAEPAAKTHLHDQVTSGRTTDRRSEHLEVVR